MYNDRIRYKLEHKKKGFLTVVDPIGYEESEVEFVRNTKSQGIITNHSSSIKFVKDGLEFIRDVKNTYGINEFIKIHREVRHPNTDEWVKEYTGTLDLTTYSLENNTLSIKINSGETARTLRARKSAKLEIEQTESIDGVSLPELPTHGLSVSGRALKLKSLLEVDEDNQSFTMHNVNKIEGQTASYSKVVPLLVEYKSDKDVHKPVSIGFSNYNFVDTSGSNPVPNGVNGEVGQMFFNNEQDSGKTRVLDLHVIGTFTPSVVYSQSVLEILTKFKLSIEIYKNGSDFVFDREIQLYNSETLADYNDTVISVDEEIQITLEEGESASFVLASSHHVEGVLPGESNPDNIFATDINEDIYISNLSLAIEEDSIYDTATTTKMVLLHELGKRLVHQMIGKDVFKSSILGRVADGYTSDGEYSLIGAYCGHWLRGFDKLPNNKDNKYKPFTTSWKDYTETLRAVFNISTGIETINGIDHIVCESMDYFYNPNIAIKLPNQVSNVKRSVASKYIYSDVEIGYEKGGEYEEVFGLDEPNGKASFVTSVKVNENVYNPLSKYRADVYGEEIQRRKQRRFNPTEDASFDKDIFLKDLTKNEYGTLVERMEDDDFTEVSGIFSPETAKNLRLSPVRNLLRHGADIGVAMKQYGDKYLKFGSSTANSSMVTQLNGETTGIAENGDILNSALGRRRFDPEYIEFDYPVDFEILQQLKGRSTFNGREVPNFYCKVQFINENNEREYGYIISVKTSNEGKWKLLKA